MWYELWQTLPSTGLSKESLKDSLDENIHIEWEEATGADITGIEHFIKHVTLKYEVYMGTFWWVSDLKQSN